MVSIQSINRNRYMRIEYLKEFILLSANLNFSTTAEQLFITQSVLSRHISALEEETGLQLLNRNTKSVSLTNVGAFFLSRAQRIVDDYDNMLEEASLMERHFKYSLRIGVNYYGFNYYLGNIPEYFKINHPETLLSFRTGNPDELVDALISGGVDVIIVTNLPFARSGQLKFHELYNEPLFVLIPKNHKLARKPYVTIEDIAEEDFVGTDTSAYTVFWNYLVDLFHKKLKQPRLAARYHQPEEVSIAVQHGDGLFIEGDLLHHMTNEKLVCLPLIGEGCTRPISLAYLPESNAIKSIEDMKDAYKALIEKGDW